MRNFFPKKNLLDMPLFTVQAIIQCYSPTDITDKGIMGYQMDKEHAGRSAAPLPRGVFLFSVHHEKGHHQEGFERRICDNMSAGVSPKHRHRHSGATEEKRRLEEMCEQGMRRDKQIPLAWSHEEPLLHCALCALLGCSILACKSPKPSQNSQIPKHLHNNSTNPATAFKNFSSQFKSSLYILLDPPQRWLCPSELTLKQFFFIPQEWGKISNSSTSVKYFPSSALPPHPPSPALLLKGESNKDI